MQYNLQIKRNELRKSVFLYNFIPDDKVTDRVLLSNGVCSAAPYNTTEINYVESAYLPRPPWRVPTKEEKDILFTDVVPNNYSTSVGLVRIPQEIVALFNQLKLNQSSNQTEFYNLIENLQGQFAVQSVEKFVRSLLVKKDEFRTIVVFNAPGLNFTAYSSNLERYMGLHVDYLHQQSIYTRGKTANRISINLGNEDRHLVYVNLTMKDLIELINPSEDCSNDNLVLSFFKRFPTYPVIKVKIAPGEAYIAPTQNIIHDGIGSKNTPDFHLTICGHIGFYGIHDYLHSVPS